MIKKKIIVALGMIVIFLVAIYMILHPTYYKYCDLWILGKNINEVQERYGEFDFKTSISAGYYIYTNDSGFLPDYCKHYYFMYFDENGIVYKVYDGAELGG